MFLIKINVMSGFHIHYMSFVTEWLQLNFNYLRVPA